MKNIIEDCKRVEIEDDGNRASKIINIIRNGGTSIKIEISNARLKGSWNAIQSGMYVCSLCGGNCRDLRIGYMNFCNKCGADMRTGGNQ